MFTRKILVSALLAALTTGAALHGMAADRFDIDLHLNVAPPPPRHEVVPQVSAGYIWSPGYWHWRDGRHVWIPGHVERARAGHVYHAPRWVARNGRWYFQGPRWDRDGDGIPNRADRDRDNDGVANRFDRDRDGDRVPNRLDNRPGNPSRY